MLFFAAVAALAVAANAQVLRISPAVIGSTSAGHEQVIALGAGGSVGQIVHHKIAPVHTVAPRTFTVAEPTVAHKFVHVQPRTHQIVKVQNFAAPQFVQQPHFFKVAEPQVVKVLAAPIAAPLKVQEEQFQPQPYAFGFDSEDEFGTKHGRQESKDASGVVTGHYTLSDASGVARMVSYIADAEGFRASVHTNEPGTIAHSPAGVEFKSTNTLPVTQA